MKIALFVHCFFPDHFYGTETYTLEVAKNLRTLGHDVTVVTAVFAGEPQRQTLITREAFEGVPVFVIDKNKLPHRNIRETYYQEEMRAPLRQILREIAPDIMHVTHLINHTAVLPEVANELKIPVIATLTDFFGFCYNNKLEAADGGLCTGPNALRSNCIACHLKAIGASGRATDLHRFAARPSMLKASAVAARVLQATGLASPKVKALASDLADRPGILFDAYRNYDAMIAPTAFLRDAYIRNGFEPERLHLSHFGVDIARTPKPRRAAGPLVVGYVGQLAPHKGVDLLLEAALKMPTGALRINVHGPENQDPTYMARLRTLAGDHTTFRGTFPPAQMAAVLSEMDILAIPSTWYENSPLVLLYALATHTPVLVANVQGLTEFIGHGGGWTFKRGDLVDLTRVLRGIVDDPAQVQTIAAGTAYERDNAAMARDIVSLYGRVIETYQPKPERRAS
jgi:glycosyltransferase involved in cell wall biosynthesis